jgi:hypothetical protein
MSSTLTNLTAATTWSGTDLFYALVGGNSRKIAASSMWTCDAANVLSDVNSTTAQTVRIYRTFTDSSNYERLALQSGSGYVELAAQTAGTGTDNLNVRLTPSGVGHISATNDAAGSSGQPVFESTSSISSGGYVELTNLVASGLTAGGIASFNIGKANSPGNWATCGFQWNADNDATNNFNIIIHSGITLFRASKAGTIRLFEGLAAPSGGSTNARVLMGSDNIGIYIGIGVPTVSAAQGSLYLRGDGGSTSTRLYVNSSSVSGTTWTNVTTAT